MARRLQGGQEQRPRPSNGSSVSSPQSPPPDSHPFNPSSNPQNVRVCFNSVYSHDYYFIHFQQQPSPVDVTQSLPPRSMNPSAGPHAFNVSHYYQVALIYTLL